jgi:hypothetical protein
MSDVNKNITVEAKLISPHSYIVSTFNDSIRKITAMIVCAILAQQEHHLFLKFLDSYNSED